MGAPHNFRTSQRKNPGLETLGSRMHQNVKIDGFDKTVVRGDVQKSNQTILQFFFLDRIQSRANFNLVRQAS